MDDIPASKRPGLGDGLRRLLDQRAEQRGEAEPQTAMLVNRGHRHVVRVANLSSSGAMIMFDGELSEGDKVSLQLLDHDMLTAQVRWVRDGRFGISFTGSDTEERNEDGPREE